MNLNSASVVSKNTYEPGNKVEVLIDHAWVTAGGDLRQHALSQAVSESTARSVDVAVAGGGSVAIAVAVGVSVARAEIDGEVHAKIMDGSLVEVEGAVLLSAAAKARERQGSDADSEYLPTARATAPALAFAAAAGGSGWGSIAVDAAGSVSEIVSELTIGAEVSDSEVVATRNIELRAIDRTEVQSEVKAIGASASVFAGSVAVPKSTTTNRNDVTTLIKNSRVVSTEGSRLALESVSLSKLTPSIETVSVAVAIGVAVGTSILDASYGSDAEVSAAITGSSDIEAPLGVVLVSASSSVEAKSEVRSHVVGVVAVDVVDQEVTTSPTVTAAVEGGRINAARVGVSALSNDLASTRLRSGDGGGLSTNVANIDATAEPVVTSKITDGANVAGVVEIYVRSTSTSQAEALFGVDEESDDGGDERGLNVGVVTIAVNDSRAKVRPTVKVDIGEATLTSQGNITVEAVGGKALNPGDGEFDAGTEVHPENDTISFEDEHGFGLGALVEYEPGEHEPIGGL
ncbi:MAG TPA: hypothetical protein EYQ27_22150, partial [Gemmatimonadetes bacterium]|nr:hypothetical protein [Gemmatimonadota bacterium]